MTTTIKAGILKPVKSSNITALGHDPETGEFYVKWIGDRLSAYANVPPDVAAKVIEAKSPGTAVRSILAPTYKHRYITGEAAPIPSTQARPQATEPRIFITVQREIGGQPTQVIREVSIKTWQSSRYPGSLVGAEIDAMLKEIGHG